jgi:hypothetical protein
MVNMCVYMYVYIYIYIAGNACYLLSRNLKIFFGSAARCGLWPPRPRGFRDYTQRRAIVVRTPLDE